MSKPPLAIDALVDVVTPENIAFRYQAAGPFRRLPAYAVDLAIRIFAGGLLTWVLAMVGISAWGAGASGAGGISIATILVMWFLLAHLYGGLFETFWNGQTPGKRALGLRVLTVDGQPINALQAVLRNLLRDVDAMPFPFLLLAETNDAFKFPLVGMMGLYWVGLVVMTCNDKFQRLGDLACGTIVVVDSGTADHKIVQFDDPAVHTVAEMLPADLVVPRRLAKALAAYVGRRKWFTPSRQQEIARYLAVAIIAKYNLPADWAVRSDLVLCAVYHRTFVTRRQAARQQAAGAAVVAAVAADETQWPEFLREGGNGGAPAVER